MENTKSEIKRETALERFRKEVSEVKPRLPEDWKTRLIAKWPEYNTIEGGRLIFDVYHLRTTDMEVLERLKVIAAQYSAEGGFSI